MEFKTNYRVAVHWLNNSFVMCNNIPELDNTIYDNLRFELDGTIEIYQWYITDASESDVEYLEKHFGLLFTYSELLDCFILCVDHYGTSWDYVCCETDLLNAQCELGESK